MQSNQKSLVWGRASYFLLVFCFSGLWVPRAALCESNQQIVFAGLSGLPPQFIDSGPDRGYGWVEYETHQIRKALKDEGFIIKEEWMTPARIEHEFKKQNPICTYPVKLSDPSSFFTSKPDRIYSIPIKLEGNEARKLMFHQRNLSKFAKHFDSKGDLKINSLLEDKTLKTLLIRDFDYGNLGRKLLTRDEKGDQIVRKDFSDHIILLLIKNNVQLLEMLNANRFDYIFADAIEDQDFESTGIKKDQFKEITYRLDQIDRNIRDPKIVMVSIACSIHPLTKKILPFINQKISQLRGMEWYFNQTEYRRHLDSRVSGNDWSQTLHVGQFRGVIESGGADYWYSMQQKHFDDLLLYPPTRPKKKRAEIPKGSHPLRWRAISEEKWALTILNESSPDYRKLYKNPYGGSAEVLPYPEAFIERYLSEEQKAFYFNPEGLFDHPTVVEHFKQLDLAAFKNPRVLTVFAHGLTVDEISVLAPFFPKLEELRVFGAGTDETTYLVSLLPKALKKLTLINCSLSRSDLPERLEGMTLLRGLHLNSSQITRTQLPVLISHISGSIEELSIGYHRGAFDLEASRAFSSKSWPRLTYLDLENNVLYDEHLESISRAIPSKINVLKLGMNNFFPRGLSRFFSREFPELEELDLSLSVVGSSLPAPVVLPPRVKRLKLWGSWISKDNIRRIKFPDELELLDLSDNQIGDERGLLALAHLGKNVEHLDLSNTGIGLKSLHELAKPGRFEKLSSLSLEGNDLSESELETLVQADFSLDRLNLKRNRIHNAGAEWIARRWVPKLTALDLSQNFISELGMESIARGLSPNLRELSLGSSIALDIRSLAEHLPQKIRMLDLQGNQLSDREMEVLSSRLPTSLMALFLSNSAFSSEGAWHLASFFPPRLGLFHLDSTPIDSQGLVHLSRILPSSLKELNLASVAGIESTAVDALAQNLPKNLKRLALSHFVAPEGNLKSVIKSLPNSLLVLNLRFAPISVESLSELGSRFPNNLRQLLFQGVKLGDEKVIALSHHLPLSIERFGLIGSEVGDTGLVEISKNSLENLYFVEWPNNRFGSQTFNEFMKKKRAVWKVYLHADDRLDDSLFSTVPQENLSMIRSLVLEGLPLTGTGLAKIIKRLPPNITSLSLLSGRVTPQSVEAVIQALPSTMTTLIVKGMDIGEVGKEKFRKHAKDQEARTGVFLQVSE